MTTAIEVAVGEQNGCVRLTDETVECWGWNGFGQLGDGTQVDHVDPQPVMLR